MELAERYPHTIFQISAGDLCSFANDLLERATDIARKQIERADISRELLSIDEVSKMLKVSRMTLSRWDKQGVLEKVEVGGKRRYRRRDIEKLLETRKPQYHF
jgi:excisionase family DNA binding protein